MNIPLDTVNIDTQTTLGDSQSATGTGADAIEHFDGSGAAGKYSGDDQLGWIEIMHSGIEDRGHNDYLRNNLGDGNGFLNQAEIDQAVDMLFVTVDADSGTMQMTELGAKAAESGLSPQEFVDAQSEYQLPSTPDELIQDQGVLHALIEEGLKNPDTLAELITPAAANYVRDHYGDYLTPEEVGLMVADDATLLDVMRPLHTPDTLARAMGDDADIVDILLPLYSDSEYKAAALNKSDPATVLRPFYTTPDQAAKASSDDATLVDIFAPFYSDSQMQAANAGDAQIQQVLAPFYSRGDMSAALADDATLVDVLSPFYDEVQTWRAMDAMDKGTAPATQLYPFLNYDNYRAAVYDNDGSFQGVLDAILQ